MKKYKRVSYILFWSGILAVIIAAVFIWYALNHPEGSFSFSSSVVYTIYIAYIIMTVMLFILANIFLKKSENKIVDKTK